MTIPILALDPLQGGYAVSPKAASVLTETEGGKPRIRQTVVGGTRRFSCQWLCQTLDAFKYFDKFYALTLSEGSLPFQVNLRCSDGEELSAHQAVFVPGTYSVDGARGKTMNVSAELDAFPLVTSDDEDLAFVNFYGVHGENTYEYLSDLARLVNVTAPDALT